MSEGNVAATADKAAGVSIARQSWQPESVAECERNSRGAKGVSREGVGSRGTDEQGGVASGDGGIPDEVYLYSLEKGFLMLRSDLRQKHGIVTANVTISVHDPCLGGRVVQVSCCCCFLLLFFLVVVMSVLGRCCALFYTIDFIFGSLCSSCRTCCWCFFS